LLFREKIKITISWETGIAETVIHGRKAEPSIKVIKKTKNIEEIKDVESVINGS
jgi:hypothetical protein